MALREGRMTRTRARRGLPNAAIYFLHYLNIAATPGHGPLSWSRWAAAEKHTQSSALTNHPAQRLGHTNEAAKNKQTPRSEAPDWEHGARPPSAPHKPAACLRPQGLRGLRGAKRPHPPPPGPVLRPVGESALSLAGRDVRPPLNPGEAQPNEISTPRPACFLLSRNPLGLPRVLWGATAAGNSSESEPSRPKGGERCGGESEGPPGGNRGNRGHAPPARRPGPCFRKIRALRDTVETVLSAVPAVCHP